MSSSGKSAEQSLDEILASLKRICADEPERAVSATPHLAATDIDASLDSLLKEIQATKQVRDTAWPTLKAGPDLPLSAGPPDAPNLASAGQAQIAEQMPNGASTHPPALGELPMQSEPRSPTTTIAAGTETAKSGPNQPDAPVATSTLQAIRLRARQAAGLVAKTPVNGHASNQEEERATLNRVPELLVPATIPQTEADPSTRDKRLQSTVVAEPVSPPPSPNLVQMQNPSEPHAHLQQTNTTSASPDSELNQTNSALENVVRELLRPMLKTWLDQEMPALVEKLLREELASRSASPRERP